MLKKFIFNISITIISTFLSLIIAEAIVRYFFPQKLITSNYQIWEPKEIFGWSHRKNVDQYVNTGEGIIHFLTDKEGYRITRKNFSSIENELSIVFIGDSFLEALQVDNQYTIPEVLKEMFHSGGIDIQVTNTGVGGWNPNHYYLQTQLLLSKSSHYDAAIIFLYAANDIVCEKVSRYPVEQMDVHPFKIPNSFSLKEFISSVLYPINNTLERSSHLFIFVKDRTKYLRMRFGLAPYYMGDAFKIERKASKCWDVTFELCKLINDTFARHGTRSFFVLIPANYQVYTDIFYSYVSSLNIDINSLDIEQPNKKMAERFKSSSLVFIDPLEYMRLKAKEGTKMYGDIDIHLSRDGHRVIAEYLAPIILQNMK